MTLRRPLERDILNDDDDDDGEKIDSTRRIRPHHQSYCLLAFYYERAIK